MSFSDTRTILDVFDGAVEQYAANPAFTGLGHTLSFSDLERFYGRIIFPRN